MRLLRTIKSDMGSKANAAELRDAASAIAAAGGSEELIEGCIVSRLPGSLAMTDALLCLLSASD